MSRRGRAARRRLTKAIRCQPQSFWHWVSGTLWRKEGEVEHSRSLGRKRSHMSVQPADTAEEKCSQCWVCRGKTGEAELLQTDGMSLVRLSDMGQVLE